VGLILVSHQFNQTKSSNLCNLDLSVNSTVTEANKLSHLGDMKLLRIIQNCFFA